jgi:hypothetical protein
MCESCLHMSVGRMSDNIRAPAQMSRCYKDVHLRVSNRRALASSTCYSMCWAIQVWEVPLAFTDRRVGTACWQGWIVRVNPKP